MPIQYLDSTPWWKWSRDERMFCAVLWEQARKDPADFAQWLITKTELDIDPTGEWDLGYEVVLYRDFLHKTKRNGELSNFSPKRTFDLCLFGERDILIIEAKLFMGFEGKQMGSFKDDLDLIPDLFPNSPPLPHIIGLACSDYWDALGKRLNSKTLKFFENKISWKQVSEKYPEEQILAWADGMRKRS
jgi:hypothetical protein